MEGKTSSLARIDKEFLPSVEGMYFYFSRTEVSLSVDGGKSVCLLKEGIPSFRGGKEVRSSAEGWTSVNPRKEGIPSFLGGKDFLPRLAHQKNGQCTAGVELNSLSLPHQWFFLIAVATICLRQSQLALQPRRHTIAQPRGFGAQAPDGVVTTLASLDARASDCRGSC